MNNTTQAFKTFWPTNTYVYNSFSIITQLPTEPEPESQPMQLQEGLF